MPRRPLSLLHIFLPGCFAVLGCSSRMAPVAAPVVYSGVAVSGNWQLSSAAPAAAKLPALSGELSGSGAHIGGVLHAGSAGACLPQTEAIAVTGSADAANRVTLAGANLAGGTLRVTGTLAADGRSITGGSYMVSGGSCAFAAPVPAIGQAYSPITGSYTGTFSDSDGQVLAITAALTQTPAADTTGNFQLSGTGSLGANPCFTTPATVSNSQVSGGGFTLTYTDPSLANSVTASGTFSADGMTLTVTSWTLSGTCGPDSGTGLLTRQ